MYAIFMSTSILSCPILPKWRLTNRKKFVKLRTLTTRRGAAPRPAAENKADGPLNPEPDPGNAGGGICHKICFLSSMYPGRHFLFLRRSNLMTQSFKNKAPGRKRADDRPVYNPVVFIIIFRLPFGGSITACCMLPVILGCLPLWHQVGSGDRLCLQPDSGHPGHRGGNLQRGLSRRGKTASLTRGFFSGQPAAGLLRHLLAGLHHRLHRAGLRRHLPQQDQK